MLKDGEVERRTAGFQANPEWQNRKLLGQFPRSCLFAWAFWPLPLLGFMRRALAVVSSFPSRVL